MKNNEDFETFARSHLATIIKDEWIKKNKTAPTMNNQLRIGFLLRLEREYASLLRRLLPKEGHELDLQDLSQFNRPLKVYYGTYYGLLKKFSLSSTTRSKAKKDEAASLIVEDEYSNKMAYLV